jgi:hypothetical protein
MDKYTQHLRPDQHKRYVNNGLTAEDMDNRLMNGSSGQREKIPANINPEYEIDKDERFFIHYIKEHKLFDQKTGARLSRPTRHADKVHVFERLERSATFKGAEIEIIHDPRRNKSQSNEIQKNKKSGPKTQTKKSGSKADQKKEINSGDEIGDLLN